MWRRSPPSSTDGKGRRPGLVLALCALAAAPVLGQTGSAAPETLRESARAVLDDPRFQRELPLSTAQGGSCARGEACAGDERGGSPPERSGELAGRPAVPQVPRDGGGASGTAAPRIAAPGSDRFALLVLAVLAAVALALFAVRGAQAWQERRRPAAIPPPAREPSREPPAGLPDDIEQLAAQGRYAEAVHALLLRVIRQLASRFRVPVPPSQTSREVLRLLPLGAEAREAFADLVRTVERSLFGGAPVGPDDYQRSLGSARLLLGRREA